MITGVGAAGARVRKILLAAGVRIVSAATRQGAVHKGRTDLNPT